MAVLGSLRRGNARKLVGLLATYAAAWCCASAFAQSPEHERVVLLKGRAYQDHALAPEENEPALAITTLRQNRTTNYVFRDGVFEPLQIEAQIATQEPAVLPAPGLAQPIVVVVDGRPTMEPPGLLPDNILQATLGLRAENEPPSIIQAAASQDQPIDRPAPSPSPAAATSASPTTVHLWRNEPLDSSSVYLMGVVNFFSNIAVLLIGLVLSVITFSFMLRRYGLSLQAVKSSELADPRNAVPDPLPEFSTLLHSDMGKRFELGRTYAQELQLKDQQEQQQEDAMLKQLFEQNLQLREQIGELQGAT